MYTEYNVCDDLIDLLKDEQRPISKSYKDVIYEIGDGHGFSYNTQIMFGMVHILFKNNLMIAHNLLQNAIDEAKGAARVNVMADKYADPILKTKMKKHVGDELRHSMMFSELIEYTGYTKEIDDDIKTINSVGDVFEFDDNLKTFICRVHSIEIRSWTMLRLYIDVLEKRNDVHLNKIIPVLEQIKADELQHVTYTGHQVNQWLQEDDDLKKRLKDCFLHTNRETWHDLSNMSNYLADNLNDLVLLNKENIHAAS